MANRFRPWWKLSVFVIVLVWFFFRLMIGFLIRGKNQKRGFRVRRKFCRAALRVFNIDVQFNGPNITGPGLYMANHRSMLDPLIHLAYLDVFILSKAEVGEYPMIGRGAKETGVFFVDRDSDNSRKAALQSIEKLLASGSPVLIYPEGTTNDKNLTADFRKGPFDIAFNSKIPVTPVMIEYPNPTYYWNEGSLIDYFKRIFTGSGHHKVIVEVGQHITADSKEELISKTKSQIDLMILAARDARSLVGSQ